jgi:hypothetical protein
MSERTENPAILELWLPLRGLPARFRSNHNSKIDKRDVRA